MNLDNYQSPSDVDSTGVFTKEFKLDISDLLKSDNETGEMCNDSLNSFFTTAYKNNTKHLLGSIMSSKDVDDFYDLIGEADTSFFHDALITTVVDVYAENKVEYNFKKHIKIIDISENLIRKNGDVVLNLENSEKTLVFNFSQPQN